MPSFDIVSKTDMTEIDNAINGARREIDTRFDFKGSKCTIERKEERISFQAMEDRKLRQMGALRRVCVTRRKLDAGALEFKDAEKAAGNAVRQEVIVKQGIDQKL